MSDIPKSSATIQIEGARTRSPTSESLIQSMGGAINFLLGLGLNIQKFTANSTYTTGPNQTSALLIGCGGGEGGNSAANSARGGSGAFTGIAIVTVTPNTTYSITIGAGGTAGSPPQEGRNTTFASLATFPGAGKIFQQAFGHTQGGIPGTSIKDGHAGDGEGSPLFNGGSSSGTSATDNGGGGAGGFGAGGNGSLSTGASAGANTGGGGGGGNPGGSGGSGILYVVSFQ